MKLLILLAIFSLAVVAQATPATYRYQCYSKKSGSDKLNLILHGRTATMDGQKGTVDASYSGGAAETYDRFLGFPSQEGEVELLVEKPLRESASRGRIRIQVRGDGFRMYLFQCYSRD